LRKQVIAALASTATAVLVTGLSTAPANGAPRSPTIDTAPAAVQREDGAAQREDNLSSPMGEQQEALRKQAIAQLVGGKVQTEQRNGSEVIKMSGNRYVEYRKKPAKTDPIFTILAEFGNQTKPNTAGGAGPVHNQIAQPDRVYDGGATDDNSTIWTSDFSQDYYQNLLFAKTTASGEAGGQRGTDSMSDYYLKLSSGRYTVGGDVSPWVTVPYNEARYGSNAINGSDGYWNFVKDSATAWYDAQLAAGKSAAEIKAYLAQFDLWDRYDYDHDGNFNEPDGYIDHFQVIHAGEGEEAGGGVQGADAIWSHRWYAFSNLTGAAGPDFNKLGGAPLGDTGVWVGDYTTEPENGGAGVFCHEYGHDLGLPDLYDTAGGDNGTGFWTIMSAGSWLNRGKLDIGSAPDYMGPWEKLFLGWLDYETVNEGDGTKYVALGAAADGSGKLPQAVVVNLPDQVIVTKHNTPYSGQYEWWGGSADGLNSTLTRTLDLTGASSASLTTKAWYETEPDFDFLYGEVSTNGGSTWSQVGTLDGSSNGNWADLSYDLSAYAGQQVLFRFRYQTDGGTHFAGPFLDNISLLTNGTAAWTDDVEAGAGAWTAAGFTRYTGTTTRIAPRFYIAENRSYVGYDDTLRTGPYNFGWASTQPDRVERFPYQDGLLVWYVNYAFEDNNTSEHPDGGLVLPVDARPTPITFPGGALLGNRRQPFDATFGTQRTDPVTFHRNGVAVSVPSQPAIGTFDDSDPNRYWSSANPQGSVKVAGTGTKIAVKLEIRGHVNVMLVKVTSPK
jgi:immune inhibitor A